MRNAFAPVFRQLHTYLTALDTAQYTASLELLGGSSIGQHTRHIIEFFDCLIQQQPQGLVNYDLRARNLQLESDTAVAIHTLHDIEAALPLLPLAQVIHLQTMYQVPPIPTTIERECAYLLEHTVHHLAMVRVGLKIVAPTLSLAADFGVAKATVAHQKASA